MIDHIIPEQGFEKVRDRIASIICKEYANQQNVFKNDYARGVKIFSERIVPIQETETTVIVISLWKGKYGNKDVEYEEGLYTFVIDILQNAVTRSGGTDSRGDALAAYKLQKHIAQLRYILEHPVYTTLEFDKPFILNTHLTDFQVLKFDRDEVQDAATHQQAQALFNVRCGEVTFPAAGVPIAGTDTQVTVEETELGFEYTINY